MGKQNRNPAAANASVDVAATKADAGDWGDTATPGNADPNLVDGSKALPEATTATPTTRQVVDDQLRQKSKQDVASQSSQADGATVSELDRALNRLEGEIAKADNHIKAFALRGKINDQPAKSGAEKLIKAALLKRVGRHCFEIQQGVRSVVTGANEIAAGLNSAADNAERLEYRSRSDRDIQDLLSEKEALKQQLAEATKKD